MRWTRPITAALILSSPLGSMTALAADPNDAIEARRGLMQVYAFNVGQVGDMAKGKTPYDAAAATTAARNLQLLVQLDGSAMWPEGSHKDNPALEVETRALPAIWENFPEVKQASSELKEALDGLAAAAGESLQSLRGAMKPVGEACKGCHKEFRAEKDK